MTKPNDEPTAGGTDIRACVNADAARIGAEIKGLGMTHDPFAAAVRATRMPMIVTDPRQPDNPVIFANSAFCRLSGYSRAEILGRNCRFLQCPDTDPAVVRRIHDAVAAGESIEIDIRNRRKDGKLFWNRLLIVPVRDAAGELAYFIASQVDVTLQLERLDGLELQNAALLAELHDRLRGQEESEARLRFATHAGKLGIWELDLQTEVLTASAICKENFGRDPNLPFTYAELCAAVVPADQSRMKQAVASSIETGTDYAIEYPVIRPNASVGWVEVRAQVVRDPDGLVLRMAGVSLDISQRKKAETRVRALSELDERLRTYEDPTQVAYFAAELLGRTLEVSRAGYGTVDTVTETITIERDWNAPGIQTLAGRLHFRDYGSYIEDLKRGDTVIIEDAHVDPRTADTADALTQISAASFINMPLTEQEGFVALLYLNHATSREWPEDDVAFVREVAQRTRMAVERRRAEADLKALAASLEQQVKAGTEDLIRSEAALRQSQKMEAVGQLTGGIAHDFNNLLAGITGSLELLSARLSQGRSADADRFISAAQGAAKRAAALTHRLLAFSRQQTLDPKPTDINRLVAGMEELIGRTVGPSVSLSVVGSAGLWPTLVDQGQLENALLNLCINARDAMSAGGKITIETGNHWLDERAAKERDIKSGQYVVLSVSDTGSGMTEEVIARAFDPFFTTKPVGQGTGLGLSMIYGFARQSGGQVRIYSEVGQGSVVRIYLPRQYGAAAPEIENESAPAMATHGVPGKSVLVVDDEPTVRMLVAEVLGDMGYSSLEAGDGPSGLQILQTTGSIELLITDVGLPGGMNGRELAIAARAVRPALKVLFITGYAENAALNHGHLEPGIQVLTKPFAMAMLSRKIDALLNEDKPGQQIRT